MCLTIYMVCFTYFPKAANASKLCFFKTSGKLGKRSWSFPTFHVYDHHFSPKYYNFLKNVLYASRLIIYLQFYSPYCSKSEFSYMPIWIMLLSCLHQNQDYTSEYQVQDHWSSGPCFLLQPHRQPHLILSLTIRSLGIYCYVLFGILFFSCLWHLLTACSANS